MSSALFACTVPGAPVPQARMRHSDGKGKGYYPPATRAQRGLLCLAFRAVWRFRDPIDQPVRVEIGLAGGRRNGDTDNFAKLALDSLVDAGVLRKDSLMIVRELVVRCVDGEPRTVVEVTAL